MYSNKGLYKQYIKKGMKHRVSRKDISAQIQLILCVEGGDGGLEGVGGGPSTLATASSPGRWVLEIVICRPRKERDCLSRNTRHET